LVDEGEENMVRHFAFQALAWTRELTLFTTGKLQLSSELRAQLTAAGVSVQDSPVRRLHGRDRKLESVELTDGTQLPCDALFAHPPQRQVPLVESLGLARDESGYLQTDPVSGETSRPGIHAAGDLTTRVQGAILAAAAATRTAAMLNAELTQELAKSGELAKRT
jgi:thioredoxin reductase